MKIYHRLLASYLIVCMIPLLLSTATIIQLEGSILQNMRQKQEDAIDSIHLRIDQDLNDAASTITLLSEEILISSLAEKPALNAAELHQLCRLTDLFTAAVNQQDSYFRSFCYFYRSGYLVSNRRTYHPSQNDLFAWELDVPVEDLDAALKESGVSLRVSTVMGKDGQGYILVLKNVYDSHYRESLSCVGMVLRLSDGMFPQQESGGVFVAREDGGLVFGGPEARQLCQAGLPQEDRGQLVLNGEGYLYSLYTSRFSGLRYGYLSRRDKGSGELRRAVVQLGVQLAAYLLFGVGAAVVLSRRTWSPFRSVLLIMDKQNAKPERGARSLRSLADGLTDFAREKETLEAQLRQRDKQMQDAWLARYLQGLTNDSRALSQYLEDGQPYRVLAFSAEGPRPEAGAYAAQMAALYQAMGEILEESLLEKRAGVGLVVNGLLAVLVQGEVSQEEGARAAALLGQALSAPAVCYISEACTRLSDAPAGWDLVSRAWRSDAFWQTRREPGTWFASQTLQYGEKGSYEEFLRRQKLLAGSLTGGSGKKAQKCLEEIIRLDLSERGLPLEVVQHRCAAVAELLLPPQSTYRDMVGLTRRANVEEMEQALWELFRQRCQDLPKDPGEDRNAQLVQSVQAYIQENFRSPAMGVGTVAEHLGMPLSTLSHRYKAAAGQGVLDTLHSCRLKEAKRLLAQGITVREAAELAGYAEPRAMIRAFKRYEGVTPAQYKQDGGAETEV